MTLEIVNTKVHCQTNLRSVVRRVSCYIYLCSSFNPLNAKLNPICHLLALLGAHHIFHVSGVRVNIYLIKHDKDFSTTVIGLPSTQHRYLLLTDRKYLFKSVWVPTYCSSLGSGATTLLLSP